MAKNELITRSITGLIFVLTILVSIYLNSLIISVVFGLYLFMAVIEYGNLFRKDETINLNFYFFVVNSFSIYLLASIVIIFKFPYYFLLFILPIIFIGFLIELWKKSKYPMLNISIRLFGYVYLVIPFLIFIYLADKTTFENHLLTGMFILIWTNDSFAYLIGKSFGKTKFFERISPKKTWEGILGGFIFTLIFAYIFTIFFEELDFVFWIVSAILVSPAAIFGDLIESLFKRSFNIKDTGSILPGHGGILDRFDASIFAAPIFLTWYFVFYHIIN